MTEPKTRPTDESVERFLDDISDEHRREDCRTIARIMKKVTKSRPTMWGASIVGYGSYHYRYESGREGDWFLTGFSPRKQSLTLYIMSGFTRYDGLLARLGKYKTGKSCLYIKRLEDVDLAVLETLIRESVAHLKKTHG
jgi:hypothetical protein